MISKEQLKHIDADCLMQHIHVLQQMAEVEQMILNAYANGLDKITIVFKHRYANIVLDELIEGGYVYKVARISDIDDGIDFYEVTIK